MMVKIPKEMIIEKIKEKTNISDQELQTKVKDKLDQLSGLISEEGALHIIANELGVKIFDDPGKLQIKSVLAGMRNVELTGKVVKIYEVRDFETEKRKGKVGSFLLGDQTGVIRVVAWNDKADLLEKLKENDIVNIEKGYTKDNRGRKEVHLGEKTTVTLNPDDAPDIEVKDKSERRQIVDLKENEENIEIVGTIVQAFEPRFFETCPECNKRANEKEDGFYCNTHNLVKPNYAYVVNLFLDDGTENVRVVLWRNQAQKLYNLTHEAILEKKDTSFDEINNELLGKIVKFQGRTNKNEMFERIEFIPQFVIMDPDPEEEIKRLNEELKKAEAQPETKVETTDDIIEETESTETFEPETIELQDVKEDVQTEVPIEELSESVEDEIIEKVQPEITKETIEKVKPKILTKKTESVEVKKVVPDTEESDDLEEIDDLNMLDKL